MRTWILGTAMVVALVAVGCGDDDTTADGNDGGDSGNGGNNGGSGSNARNDGGPNGGGSGTGGVVVGDGSQFTGCRSNADCDTGLNCYTFGGYCSAQCSGDADCSSLGANAGCYQAGGGMMGGFFGGAGGATGSGGSSGSTASGTCRVSCTGADDASCPTGLMCIDVGAGSWRCALPGAGTMGGSGGAGGIFGGAGGAGFFGGSGGLGGMQTPGDTEAFEECTGGGCVEGLICSSGFGRGFCTQTCQNASDCTNDPGSGDATLACGRNGRCILECTVDSDECPDGMTCTRQGGPGGNNNNGEDGGAPVTGRCNYTN